MKKNLIHSIPVWLAIFLLPFLAACRSSEDAVEPESMEVGLYLNIAPIVESRADMRTLLDNEKMKSLRVVVLHENGKVEHNKFYHLLSEEQGNKLIILKVTPNEKKKIYLFANEESVTNVEFQSSDNKEEETDLEDKVTDLTSFFKEYKEESEGFETAVNSLYFEPKYTDDEGNYIPIPMSSMYEVKAPPQGYNEEKFYVVRVATKFTVNFENWRDEEVKVNSFSISSYADKNFLMARVNSFPDQREDDPAWKWINWMKAKLASSENDTETAGWLKDYDLPKAANHTKTYEKKDITVSAWSPSKEGPGTPGEGPTMYFYLPESKNIEEGATEQEYTMTIKIDVDGNEKSFEFKLPNTEAPNLEALFRNTHVVINILIKDNIELKVDLHPYTSVELKPLFGITYNEN